MASEGVVITISGDDTALEKTLDGVSKKIKSLSGSASAAGQSAGEGFGGGLAGGTKKGLQLVTDNFRQTSALATGSFSGIAEAFLTTAVNPIVLGAAAIGGAILGAFKLTQIGEENAKIARNFSDFATQAGLNADYLKNRISGIAAGFIDLEDALPKASDAILTLGKNANKLPELFELARNIGVKSGKDIAEVFEGLTKGIASGSERMLRANKISLDTNAVLEKYAAGLGTTANKLTDAAKQQAILNAVIEQGKNKFAEIDETQAPVAGGIRRMTLAFDDLKDALAEIANSKLGDFFASVVSATASAVSGLAGSFKLLSGDLGTVDEQIARAAGTLKGFQVQQDLAFADPTMQKFYQDQIDKTIEKLKLLGDQKATNAALEPEGAGPGLEETEKVKGPTIEEQTAHNDALAAIEAEKNLVFQQMQIDHNAALQLLNDEDILTTQEKNQIALNSTILRNVAEYDAQVDKNKKIKLVKEEEAANDLARQKLAYANSKAIDDQSAKDKVALAKFDKDTKDLMLATSSNFISAGIKLAKDGSAEQKALMVAQAIQSTYVAANNALANPVPYPVAVAFAASAIALGLVNVAQILGANDGALVTGGSTGIDSVPYLLSKGEVVAPARSFDEVVEGTARQRGFVQRGEENESGGGGGIVISIQGDVIGDEQFINNLADKIRDAVQFRDASLV